MTAQPVGTTTTEQARAAASGAATAAAPLIPAPHPLSADPGSTERPHGSTPAFVATFTGGRSGEVVLVLDQTVATALSSATVGVQVEDAVRPALEAAAQSLGPCVLGPVRGTTADELAAGRGTEMVALVGQGTATAWIGVSLRSDVGVPPVPRQQQPTDVLGAAGGAFAGAGLQMNGLGLHLLRGVEMTLSVEIGRARMTVHDLLQLGPGSVVELDRAAGAPADLLVNGRLIARGEVVVVDEDFGLRIIELVQPSGETPL